MSHALSFQYACDNDLNEYSGRTQGHRINRFKVTGNDWVFIGAGWAGFLHSIHYHIPCRPEMSDIGISESERRDRDWRGGGGGSGDA